MSFVARATTLSDVPSKRNAIPLLLLDNFLSDFLKIYSLTITVL